MSKKAASKKAASKKAASKKAASKKAASKKAASKERNLKIWIAGDAHWDAIREATNPAKSDACKKSEEKVLFRYFSGVWQLQALIAHALKQSGSASADEADEMLAVDPARPRASQQNQSNGWPVRRFCQKPISERDDGSLNFRVRIESGQPDWSQESSKKDGDGNNTHKLQPGDDHILAFYDAGISFFEPSLDSSAASTAPPPDGQSWLENLPHDTHDSQQRTRNAFPLIIASMSDSTPRGDALRKSLKQSTSLWGTLYREHRDRTMVVVNASALRHAGANITSELSWEQTAQEFVTEIFKHDIMKELALFRHLVVRLGHSGAIYSSGFGRNTDHRLFYHPTVSENLFCQSPEETTLGGNKIFVASIVDYLVKAWKSMSPHKHSETKATSGNSIRLPDSEIDGWICDAIRLAVLRVHNQQVQGHPRLDLDTDAKHFQPRSSGDVPTLEDGYCLLPDHQTFFFRGYKLERLRRDAKRRSSSAAGRRHTTSSKDELYPYIADTRIPVGTATWTILSESSEFDLERVAADIVYRGLPYALNAPARTRTERLIELIDEVIPKGLRKSLDDIFNTREDDQQSSRTSHQSKQTESNGSAPNAPSDTDTAQYQNNQYDSMTAFLDCLEQHLDKFPEDRMLPDHSSDTILKELSALMGSQFETSIEPFNGDCDWLNFCREWTAFVSQLDIWSGSLSENAKKRLSKNLDAINKLKLRSEKEKSAICSESLKQNATWKQFIEALIALELLHQEFAELDHSKDEYGNIRPVFTPVAKFANLETVDREEIESLRSVGKLIEQYVAGKGMFRHGENKDEKDQRPLSIAVFGQPGGGKSFAVKQIIKSIDHSERFNCPIIEINLSQLDGYEELVAVLERGRRDIEENERRGPSHKDTIPVYFFDEFDSKLQGQDLGWLQCFLAMMEDGVYLKKNENRTVRIGRAILVFAGATSRTYRDFCRDDADGSDLAEFTMAKGPDFVSRLMGHINIVGVNPGSDSDESYLIRRAIHIRSALARCLETEDCRTRPKLNWVPDDDEMTPLIERDVLHAMLRISRYRHGARSIRAILQMSTPVNERIQKSSLPTRTQLEMHVNSKEFFDLLNANGDTRRHR